MVSPPGAINFRAGWILVDRRERMFVMEYDCDVPLDSHNEDQAKELLKSKDIQEVLHAMRDYQEAHRLPQLGPIIKNSNFLTLVA